MCTMGPYAASLMSLAKLTSLAFCYAAANAQLMDLIGLESNMSACVAESVAANPGTGYQRLPHGDAVDNRR